MQGLRLPGTKPEAVIMRKLIVGKVVNYIVDGRGSDGSIL